MKETIDRYNPEYREKKVRNEDMEKELYNMKADNRNSKNLQISNGLAEIAAMENDLIKKAELVAYAKKNGGSTEALEREIGVILDDMKYKTRINLELQRLWL